MKHQLHGIYDMDELSCFCTFFVGHLVDGLDNRFPDLEVLRAFQNFDPVTYRGMEKRRLDDFGMADFRVLLKHFCRSTYDKTLVPLSADNMQHLDRQFRTVKRELHSLINHQPGITAQGAWEQISRDHGSAYHLIYPFVHAMFLAPVECGGRARLQHRVRAEALAHQPLEDCHA